MTVQPVKEILVVDDERELCEVISEILEESGYKVTRAFDAPSALDLVKHHSYDAVLTDIVMPGIDGIEVARQAAAKHPGLRIMFITGFAAVALAAGEKAPAGSKVLSKPIHLREIVSEVERMIAA